MPPVVSASLLFHPKRGVNRSTPLPERKTPSGTPPGSQTPSQPSPKPTTTTNSNQGVDDDASLQLPDVPYQEFRLMSSALNGWRYDVMKFDSRKPIDISTWQAPIKLNRKEPRRDDGTVTGVTPVAVGPMLGPDGKPVIGMDGRVVMVDAEGRPIHPSIPGGGDGGSWRDSRMKMTTTNGRKKFQKKTRQVFLVPDATRQLRREERYPWVMEDASQREVWVGKLEEVSKSETQALFMPAANDVFKFVPAHRWYKFQKKPNYHIPSLEEAESIMARHQKNKDPERWLLHNRQGRGPSAATAAVFRAQSEGRSVPGSEGPQSLGPGGRKLKTVDSGMDGLFEEDEDNKTKRKKQKEYGGEGDMDEMEYEEDFADDEEKVEEDNEDEEAKELEERLKREYKNANKQREGYVDESEEEDDGSLTRDGKAMKKLIRNLEKNAAYDSDDEKNPYASSDAEEEEEPVTNGKDSTTQPPPPPTPAPAPAPTTPSRSGSQPPKPQTGTAVRGQPTPTGGSTNVSRATSPSPAGGASNVPVGGMGGHSIVAKRATSPKPRTTGVAVTASPGAPRSSPGSRASSPTTTGSGSQKRKASEDGSGVGIIGSANGPKPKKRKGTLGGLPGGVPVGELEDRMVIEWLRNTPNASTRDCIQHFTPYLTDETKKSKFTALVKEVAQLKAGVLVLRNAYRTSS